MAKANWLERMISVPLLQSIGGASEGDSEKTRERRIAGI